MRIVLLDAYPLNPGDLSWDSLENLGDVTRHDRSAPEQILEHAAAAEAVLVAGCERKIILQ